MKRIITCSDGTWNKPGSKDRGHEVETNVEKMFKNICGTGVDEKGVEVKQVKAYDEGVGTGFSVWNRITGGATGAGIDKNIKDMYAFICLNYEPGDEIYLFGFSRGAYTARSLSGFIRNCGLLKPAYFQFIDKAFELYRDKNKYTQPDTDLMKAWRKQYCFEDVTPIMFIGVWDTVGSLGVPLPFYKSMNTRKYKFHDCTLSSFVKNAYHALAIHEKRRLFEPTLWELSETVKDTENHPQTMEQRWFNGVHSNVGGGYQDTGLSDIALKWIIESAEKAGLCFHNPYKAELKPNYLGEIRNSFTVFFWPFLTKKRKIALDNKNYCLSIDDTVWELYDQSPGKIPANLKPHYLKRKETLNAKV